MTDPLDVSPAAFMAASPRPLSGNTAWAARYAAEIRRVVHAAAAEAPRSLQVHLGPSEIGHMCLSGETEVVTRQGIRKIRDLAKDGSADLLVPLLYKGSDVRKRWGKFCQVPVECFGEQELYEITLRRNRDTKVVFATAEHHWYRSYWSGKQKKQQKLETRELLPGHRLTQLRRARPRHTALMPVAVAQGFVFGDGTKGSDDDRHRPTILNLYHNGKYEGLTRYFPGEHKVCRNDSQSYAFSEIRGLPRFWKKLPPIDESTSFLMSWLAGYFAADGCVTDDGHCSLSSAYEEHLKFVQDVAAICGIGYGQVRKYMRRGISGNQPATEETPLYRLSLRCRDLPDWFFLIAQHAQRARETSLTTERDPHWIVESVRATGRTESVYCAITGDAGAFALADDLMTGNCDRQVAGKLAGIPRTNHVVDPWPSILGTATHAWLEQAFRADNNRLGRIRWVPETRVVPIDGHSGTADLYDADEQSVDDHKGVWIDTPVPTPDGWTTIGALVVGDQVFGADGRPCRVTRVYPIQQRDCYRIRFTDGSHLITDDVQELPFARPVGKQVRPMPMSVAAAVGQVWSTAARPQRQLRVYNGAPIDLPERELVVHPYVLGCWLGDGGVHGGQIGKPDDELFEHIAACGYAVGPAIGQRQMVRTVFGLSTQLQQLGVQWVDEHHGSSHRRLAGHKRVPEQYLRASRGQRLALLQGLMDTDGTWNRHRNQAVFTTTDKGLAESVAELVLSLGWKAKIFPQQAHGFGRTITAYHVTYTPFSANPFRLSRKARLVRLAGTTQARYRLVASIEPTVSVPTRCIDVDSPDHLYLCGPQMLPVHNCLGESSMAKVRSPGGPPRHYVVQLLLYARGYRRLGLPVRRVALLAYPRTAASLDGLYVWERPYTPADEELLDEVVAQLQYRKRWAAALITGAAQLMDVPADTDDECIFCPLYRPQSARDGGPGCPGAITGTTSTTP